MTQQADPPRARHIARQPLRIDVNVGDPVTPAPTIVSYPALLGQPFPLLAYPIEAVLAEKLVTMVARGDTTTRDRDFADVLLLAGHHDINAVSRSRAVSATAGFRQVALRAISSTLVTLGRDRRRDWQRLLARAGLEASCHPTTPGQSGKSRPSAIQSSPALTSGHWDHRQGQWTA